MHRLLRNGLIATVACGVAALALSMGPAGAVPGAGGGIVDGSVTITSPGGIDTTPRATTYSFAPIQLVGAVVTAAPSAFVGCITTGTPTGGFGPGIAGITWPQGGETVLGGTGNVTAFSVTSVGAPCPGGAPNVGTLTGSCSSNGAVLPGGFIRVGPIVLVLLGCSLSVNGGAPTAASIAVASLFAPPVGQNGVTVPITSASFVGAFAGAGL